MNVNVLELEIHSWKFRQIAAVILDDIIGDIAKIAGVHTIK